MCAYACACVCVRRQHDVCTYVYLMVCVCVRRQHNDGDVGGARLQHGAAAAAARAGDGGARGRRPAPAALHGGAYIY